MKDVEARQLSEAAKNAVQKFLQLPWTKDESGALAWTCLPTHVWINFLHTEIEDLRVAQKRFGGRDAST